MKWFRRHKVLTGILGYLLVAFTVSVAASGTSVGMLFGELFLPYVVVLFIVFRRRKSDTSASGR